MQENIIEVEYKVFGRVQYVMYRDFVKRKADKYELRGFVKNNRDGSVTVVAQGDNDKISKFERKLWQGPLLAKVTTIEKVIRDSKQEFTDFKIKYE